MDKTNRGERSTWPPMRVVLGVAAVAIAAVVSTRAWTQTPTGTTGGSCPVDVTGAWELAISEDEARNRLNQAIDRAVDEMPPIVDSIAAGQLRGRTPLSREVDITVSHSRIVVTFDYASYDTVPGVVEVSAMTGEPNETVDVVQRLTNGSLRQDFRTANGSRRNTFSVSPNGQELTFEVFIESPRLPAPVRFMLPYRRARV